MCFNIPCFRKMFFIPKYPYPSRILLFQIFYCVFYFSLIIFPNHFPISIKCFFSFPASNKKNLCFHIPVGFFLAWLIKLDISLGCCINLASPFPWEEYWRICTTMLHSPSLLFPVLYTVFLHGYSELISLDLKKRLRSIQTLSLTSLEYKKILDNTTFEIFLTNDSKCTIKNFGFLGRSGFPCRPHVLDILKTWAQKMLRNFQQNKSNWFKL